MIPSQHLKNFRLWEAEFQGFQLSIKLQLDCQCTKGFVMVYLQDKNSFWSVTEVKLF